MFSGVSVKAVDSVLRTVFLVSLKAPLSLEYTGTDSIHFGFPLCVSENRL